MQLIILIAIGIGAGILAGMFGVGGGLVIVPALVLVAGYPQIVASGTSLVALLAPVGLGGVYAYYQAGKIDASHIRAGLIISIGMFLGTFVGSKIAMHFSDFAMKRAFCVFLLFVAAKMWWS